MATSISIVGLAPEANEDNIRELFTRFGNVKTIEIAETKRNKGIKSAVVVMSSSEAAQKALFGLRGKDFLGRKPSMRQASIRRIS